MAADLKIYDEISKWWGVSADEVTAEIDAIYESGEREINMYINSPGGSIFEAVPIYNRLVRFSDKEGGTVNAIVDGIAASAASWLAMAADRIKMYQNTTLMIHNSLVVAYGHKEDLRESADFMEDLDEQMVDMYVSRTSIEKDEIIELMDGRRGDGTTFTAKQAKEKGFIDEIVPLKLKTKDTGNKHDFAASFKRLLIKNYPKHLLNEDCDCDRCKKRRAKNDDPETIEKFRADQRNRRNRDLQLLRMRQRSN